MPAAFGAFCLPPRQSKGSCIGSVCQDIQTSRASVRMSYGLYSLTGMRLGSLEGLEAKAINIKQSAGRSAMQHHPGLDLRSLRLAWAVEATRSPLELDMPPDHMPLVLRPGRGITGPAHGILLSLQGALMAGSGGLSTVCDESVQTVAFQGRQEAGLVSSALWAALHTAAVELPAMDWKGVVNWDSIVPSSPSIGIGLQSSSDRGSHILTRSRARQTKVPMLQSVAELPPLAGGPYGLLPKARGSLSAGLVRKNLTAEETWENVPAGKCWVSVRAVGINFRDVLNVLGMYPGDPGPPGESEMIGIYLLDDHLARE